jgi:zinc and cadmium transporter
VGSAGTVRWSAIGLLALFFLERFFSFHHHEPPASADPPAVGDAAGAARAADHEGAHGHGAEGAGVGAPAAKILGWGPAVFGLAVHSLVGGLALASSVVADTRMGKGAAVAGLGVFVATLVHKPADALTITALMLRAGAGRRYTHLVNLGFALMIPAGVGLFWVGTLGIGSLSPGAWTAGALAFSAGTFLCIALSDLLPELQFHSHDRFKLSLALLAGFALMAGTAMLEPAGSRESSPARLSDPTNRSGPERPGSGRGPGSTAGQTASWA